MPLCIKGIRETGLKVLRQHCVTLRHGNSHRFWEQSGCTRQITWFAVSSDALMTRKYLLFTCVEIHVAEKDSTTSVCLCKVKSTVHIYSKLVLNIISSTCRGALKFTNSQVSEWIFKKNLWRLGFPQVWKRFMRLENISFTQKQKWNQRFLMLWFPIDAKNLNKSA